MEARWPRPRARPRRSRRCSGTCLAEPLDADRAARIALIANPELQAELEDLGIGQADLAQATPDREPVAGGLDSLAPGRGRVDKVEAGIAENLLDVFIQPCAGAWARPCSKRPSCASACACSGAAARAKTALYTVQASDQLLARLATLRDVHQAAFELAQRQLAAGNIADLDLANQQASFEESRIAVLEADAQARVDREQLNPRPGGLGRARRLSRGRRTAGDSRGIRAAGTRSAGARTTARRRGEPGRDRHRRKSLALKRGTRSSRRASRASCASATRTARCSLALLRVQIPIFDTGAASAARLEALYRQSQRQRRPSPSALVQVRSATARLTAARQTAEAYATIVIPLRARILDLTLRNYNMMLRASTTYSWHVVRAGDREGLRRELARLLAGARGARRRGRRSASAAPTSPRPALKRTGGSR